MPKTITSVQVNYSDGTSASLTQDEFTSPFAPGGKIVLNKPKAPTGPEIAANPDKFDNDPANDPSLLPVPPLFCGQRIPPVWREIWSQPTPEDFPQCTNLGDAILFNYLRARLDFSRLTLGQRQRFGL